MKVVRIIIMLMILNIVTVKKDKKIDKTINTATECDLDLMNSFKLVGMKHPTSTNMPKICPYIEQNCCTLMDELTISKFWNEYSKPKINKYVNLLMILYNNIFNYQKFISLINFNNISLYVADKKIVHYKERYCSFKQEIGKIYNFDLKTHWKKKNKKKKGKKKGKKQKKVKKNKRSRELRQIENEIKNDSKFEFISGKEFNKLSKERKDAIINLIYLGKRYSSTVQKAGKKFHNFVQSRGRKLIKKAINVSNKLIKKQRRLFFKNKNELKKKAKEKAKKKLEEEKKKKLLKNKDNTKTEKKIEKSNTYQIPKFYKEMSPPGVLSLDSENAGDEAAKVLKRIKEVIDAIFGKSPPPFVKKIPFKPNLEPFKPKFKFMDKFYKDKLEKGDIFIEEMPDVIELQKTFFKHFFSQMRYMAYDEIEAENHALDNKLTEKMPPSGTKFIDKILAQITKLKYPFAKIPFIPEVDRKFEDEFPSFQGSVTTCKVEDRKFLKYLLMTNAVKYTFCKSIYKSLQKANQLDIKLYLNNIRDEAIQLFGIKKGLYCGLCDAGKHEYFDSEKGLLYYSENFCYDILNTYQAYIKFTHIIFVEYADDIIQYMACIDSKSDNIKFPYRSVFTKLKWRIQLFKNCFSNLDSEDFMKYCTFICKNYKLNGHNKQIEGDLNNIYHLFVQIIEFLRKHDIAFEAKMEITEDTLEELDHEFYKERKLTESKKENSDFEANVPVYRAINKVVHLQDMENVFLTRDDGFNPFQYAQFANFELNIKQFIYDNFLKNADKPIDESVIQSFFNSSTQELHDFNSDIYQNVKIDDGEPDMKDNDYDPNSVILGNNPTSLDKKKVKPNVNKEIPLIFN